MDTRRNEQPNGAPRTSIRATGGSLAPGGVVGDGRYRLLAQLGVDERANAHFWRARDGQLRRDVALTLILGDQADLDATREARRTLERAAHTSQFGHPHVARVLDVLTLGSGIAAGEGLLGIIVAEWSKGTDLIDIVDEGPVAPVVACRMIDSLVSAVEQAHRSGLVLGLDHPQRIRRGPDGQLRLAFPGPLPETTLRDDIKALGAVLYLLLTARWPLPGGPAAIAPAPHAPNGGVVPPRSLEPTVPAELSSLAVRTLSDGGEGGIRTSSAFLRVLQQVAATEERKAAAPAEGAATGSDDPDSGFWTTKRPVSDPARRKKVALGATALVVAAVAILAWIGLSLISFFSEDDTSGPDVNVAESGEQNTEQKTSPSPPPETPEPVRPASIQVYNPEGTGDFTSLAPAAIDGDPGTPWQTDQYKQQLPALKSGVGLVVSFDQPIDLARVLVVNGTPATRVEIRTAEIGNPFLDNTRLVAGPTDLEQGPTQIDVDNAQPTSHVVVWLTQLGGQQGKFQSSIGDLEFYRRPS
ncbi:protein kinase family protein [Haloechinothrix halophila]|uniref:protein kinase family protein n=1 Tax=Haloechinothrix halophila TaxID=1069073 RepID=UPI00040F6E3A|nr:protein kinase family protein [Haloechinothrix halophila]